MQSEQKTCDTCPHPDECLGRACLYEIAASDIEKYQSPTLMLPAQAKNCMAALRAGGSVRSFTNGGRRLGPPIVTATKLKKHCDAYPIWGAMVQTLAANNRLLADSHKADHRRSMTHCKYGHTLANAYVRPNARYLSDRECLTCKLQRAKFGEVMKPEVLVKVQVQLRHGSSISQMTKPGQPNYLLSHATLNRYRRENAAFDALVTKTIEDGPGLRRIRRRQRARHDAATHQANDYSKIRSMVPANLPDYVRDDITQDVMIALLEGALARDGVRNRVAHFVRAHNRMFPTKYAMRSLDAPAYRDGAAPLIETVSAGLWD